MALETRSQQCPSQMSTLQQNINYTEESQNDTSLKLPRVVHTQASPSALLNEPHITSPYIVHKIAINSSQQSFPSHQMAPANALMMQINELRPNTTNPVAQHIYIVNDNDRSKLVSNIQQKNNKFLNQHTPQTTFQHPRVGRNSKHPEVFKQNQSGSSYGKNASMAMNNVFPQPSQSTNLNDS
jgi:hypothetical protein